MSDETEIRKELATHGKRIKKLLAELDGEIEKYLGFCGAYPLGHPWERRKQLALLIATVSADLKAIQMPDAAQHRRWLAARPESGLIVK